MTLKNTFTWSTAALVLVAQAATVGIALYFASIDSGNRAQESLEVAYAVASSFMHERDMQLQTSVSVLAQDFALRKAIASNDLPTVQSALRNHASRIKADHSMLISMDGAVLAAAEARLVFDSALWPSMTAVGDQLITLEDSNRNLYQIVVSPVRAPDLIGWVSMGFRVNDELANKIRSMTGTDVIFSSIRSELTYASTGVTALTSGSDKLVLSRQLPGIGAPVLLVLSISERAAMDAFYRLRNFTIPLMVAAIVAAAMLGLMLSRRLTRNLDALTTVAREVQVGNYAAPLPKVHGDEVAELSGALQSMQECIAERESEIRHQALHDSLTGLPNQDEALETLSRIQTDGTAGHTLLVATVRGVQDLNTSLGLEFGDHAVRRIAEILSAGPIDYLARLSDSRFLILVRQTDENFVEELTREFHLELQLVTIAPDVQARFDISFGATRIETGIDPNNTIRRAWSASLEANQYNRILSWYTIDFTARRERRLTIMRDLRSAELEDQLSLLYQPKLDTRNNRFCGAEALLRWNHPDLGGVPVDEFIAIAEQTLDIRRLTRWVLRTAASQIGRWRRIDPEFHVAVNVSAHDVAGDGLSAFIRKLLHEHKLPGTALQLEVTEGALVMDLKKTTSNLLEIQNMGVQIAIDDYGAGFSSLSQLRNLPAQILKIDKSFVMQLGEQANRHIVQSAINLGHALSMRVVAEGVEDAGAQADLTDWGCDYLQGYHLSRPVQPEKIEALMGQKQSPSNQVLLLSKR